jgi:hypothetical protein
MTLGVAGVTGRVPSSMPSLTSLEQPYYDACIVRAVEQVNNKQSGRATDKLAILGNLTEYHWRIDTMVIEEQGLSLSACVIALALYNGDTSLSFAFGYPMVSTFQIIRSFEGRGSNRILPEWLPDETASLRVSNSTHARKRAKPERAGKGLVLGDMLLFDGLLWKVLPFHGLEAVKDDLLRLHEVDRFTHSACLQPIVRRLFALNRKDLVEAVLIVGEDERFDSPVDLFALVFALEDWFHGRREWPLGNRYYRNASLLCNLIRNDMPVAVGSCKVGEETVSSVFECDADRTAYVFTPTGHLSYEFGACSPGRRLLSWCVTVLETEVEQDKINYAINALETTPTLTGPNNTSAKETSISSKPLQITEPVHVLGYWSPALSPAGLLRPVRELKTWRMIPLRSGIKLSKPK